MSSKPRFRVIGLVVGGALVALAAGFFLLSRGQSSSSAAPHTVVPLSKRTSKPVATTPAATEPAAKPKTATGNSTPTPKPAKEKPKPTKPAAHPPAVDGVPGTIAAALAHKRVVVVALYAPRVELDQAALREAEAGAKAVGAGFVAFNVLDESQSRPLTTQLGVLEDPSVLVYRRPNEVVVRFRGFADQETIAQAARNAGL